MASVNGETIRAFVRETYGRIASDQQMSGCCGPSGCGSGYSEAQRQDAPEGADLGLGCGNPHAIATLRPGERVLDLGSGAGFDVFVAARQVGESGAVIGVDMTPEMLMRARAHAQTSNVRNVEFRLGEIEHLPVADESVDVVMSNCVINLSTDKPAVFREAYRVLVPGGRLAVSDIIALEELPDAVRHDLQSYAGCVSGAVRVDDVERMIGEAGFADVHVDPIGNGTETAVASAVIRARKPIRQGAHG